MNRGSALTSALLATLATPVTWPLALAAFLLRGGIVVFALPILVLPTPVGLGNFLAPTLTSIVFGSAAMEVAITAVAISIGLLAWLVLGWWLAAGLESAGARVIAREEDVVAMDGRASPTAEAEGQGDGLIATRILAARLVAFLPLLTALGWGSVRLVFVTYRELTNPTDAATAIALRVVRAAPEVIVAIVLTWMFAEIVGAIAARRISVAGDGVFGALGRALATSVRHPLATLVRFWVPSLVLLLVLAPSALAAASAWDAVRAVLDEGASPVWVLVLVVAFVVLWMVGLLLAGVVCAWRAAVWTVAEVIGEGTFGGSSGRRPGDWRPDPSSANL